MSEKLKLWFFRDLNDEQRLKLFGLFDLPIKDIGKNHGKQDVALQYIMKAMIKMVAEATAPAPEKHVAVEDEIARVVQSVNEWDDRTSPDDYPEHLLITSQELTEILRNFAATLEVK